MGCLTCEQRSELMRRGDLDCHIPEHGDALRQLGRVCQERDRVRRLLDIVSLERDQLLQTAERHIEVIGLLREDVRRLGEALVAAGQITINDARRAMQYDPIQDAA
jgi:hypothetical protein